MHDSMTERVMRAPVGWFERTPLGRILNRFSSDIQEVDKDVMDALGSTLVCTFSALSIVVVISYTVSQPRNNVYLGGGGGECWRNGLTRDDATVFITVELRLLYCFCDIERRSRSRPCQNSTLNGPPLPLSRASSSAPRAPRPLSPSTASVLKVPFLILALVPISCIAVVLGKRYLNASRELKRLDSVSKSPIYAHFAESVNGVSTM